ncbi:MAG: RNA methyltransferase, partial [Eubacteriales bacterium]|nr:RNA methyltransferase [Eubacteriales bacterium]
MAKEALQENAVLTLLLEEGKVEQYRQYILDSIETLVFSKEAFKKFSNAKTPQGIACVCKMPSDVDLKSLGTKIVLLNGVQDSGNVGTIWRTAEAAGFSGLMLDKKSADPFSPKVVSASKGACFRIPAKRVANLGDIISQSKGFSVIGTSLEGVPLKGISLSHEKTMLIIGSEG